MPVSSSGQLEYFVLGDRSHPIVVQLQPLVSAASPRPSDVMAASAAASFVRQNCLQLVVTGIVRTDI